MIECPKCGSADIHVARKRKNEKLITLFYWRRPYRCEDCLHRFYGPDKKLFTFGRSVALSLVGFFIFVTGVTVYQDVESGTEQISFFEEKKMQFGGSTTKDLPQKSQNVNQTTAVATPSAAKVTDAIRTPEKPQEQVKSAETPVVTAAVVPDKLSQPSSSKLDDISATKTGASITEKISTLPAAVKKSSEAGTDSQGSNSRGSAEETALAAITRSEEDKKLSSEKVLAALVQKWAGDWASQDVGAYLSNYSKSFRTQDGVSVEQWAAGRRQRVLAPAFIDLSVRDVQPVLHSLTIASVTFVQTYKSNTYRGNARKRLWYWKTGDSWHIVKEEIVNEF